MKKQIAVKLTESSVAPLASWEKSVSILSKKVGKLLEHPFRWHRRVIASQRLLLVIMGVAGYFYYQYYQAHGKDYQQEIFGLTQKLEKIVYVPTDEIPTLATVTNKSKLDDQPFFQRAENGDKILIYRSVGRAFLYRPSTGKLIDISSIEIETGS